MIIIIIFKNHDYKENFQACHQHAIAEFPAGKFMILKEEDGGGQVEEE